MLDIPGQPLEATQETRYHQGHALLVGRGREFAVADVNHVSWGQLRGFIMNHVSTTLCHVALLWHGDMQCCEQKPCSHREKARGKIHSWSHSPLTCLGFFRKGIFQKSDQMHYHPWEISEVHVPTRWVTKTTLSLKIMQVPGIYVQQTRNYSGTCSSCSNRSSSSSNELFFSICFVATFHNVKYWGPSPLTFLLRLLQFHAKALLVEKFNTTVMWVDALENYAQPSSSHRKTWIISNSICGNT